MDRLCDEILQIILNELDDPTNFSLASKRYYNFTQDPYVRASYFVSRYGKVQALYYALGRGRLMTPQILDTLLSSGAHLSRYLAQCVLHHYFRAQVPFIKTTWARSLRYSVLAHFMTIVSKLYGDEINLTKGEDDGSLVTAMLKESRFPTEQRLLKWEMLRDVLEKYKFIPFCNKDPLMAQFPLVLAIEPRLLPFARANGFYMDCKYRNFVFRKMFERPANSFDGRADEIIRNVRELSRLDPQMFLSRTVAAEICMEAKTNESAYNALKRLDKEGSLKFDLSSVVRDLIKLFANTRSISNSYTTSILRHLYADFPSSDPLVRLVLLLQVFLSAEPPILPTSLTLLASPSLTTYINSCKDKIEALGLAPVKRTDLLEILSNKFAPERFIGVLEFGRSVLNMARNEVEGLVQEVALRCLELGCKGKMLKKLLDTYPFLDDVIREHVMKKFKLTLDDLPPPEDERACSRFEAPLCKDFVMPRPIFFGVPYDEREGMDRNTPGGSAAPEDQVMGDREDDEDEEEAEVARAVTGEIPEDLGEIGQDTLSTMIRKDEQAPLRGRRRYYDAYISYSDTAGKLTYPPDYLQVGRLIRTHFGLRSAVTAIFLLHAVVNGNPMVVQPYGGYLEPSVVSERVPITLKQFKLLARLGRAPSLVMFDDIEAGTEFYFGEEDYLSPEELSGVSPKSHGGGKRRRIRIKMVSQYSVKVEGSPTPSALPPSPPGPSTASSSSNLVGSPKGRRRPRRSTTTSVKSYVVPDSDDEQIADAEDEMLQHVHAHAKKRKVESNLQKWIKHLAVLLKEEQKKYNEKKRRALAAAPPGTKVRVHKSEFFKTLAHNLQRLRKTDKDKRQQLYGVDVPDADYSSGEEDEYQDRTTRSKRRKVEATD